MLNHDLSSSCTQYLTYDDFVPLMDCVLKFHPGLEFLAETAEFQKKYAETVVLRIFYSLNRQGVAGGGQSCDTGLRGYRAKLLCVLGLHGEHAAIACH